MRILLFSLLAISANSRFADHDEILPSTPEETCFIPSVVQRRDKVTWEN